MRKTLLAVALSVTALSAHADYQCSVTPRDDVILSPQQVQVKGENGDLVIKPDGNLTFNGKAYALSAAQREQAQDYQASLRSSLPWIDEGARSRVEKSRKALDKIITEQVGANSSMHGRLTKLDAQLKEQMNRIIERRSDGLTFHYKAIDQVRADGQQLVNQAMGGILQDSINEMGAKAVLKGGGNPLQGILGSLGGLQTAIQEEWKNQEADFQQFGKDVCSRVVSLVKGENGDLVIKPDGNLTFNGKAYALSAAQREQAQDYQASLRSSLPWIDEGARSRVEKSRKALDKIITEQVGANSSMHGRLTKLDAQLKEQMNRIIERRSDGLTFHYKAIDQVRADGQQLVNQAMGGILQDSINEMGAKAVLKGGGNPLQGILGSLGGLQTAIQEEWKNQEADFQQFGKDVCSRVVSLEDSRKALVGSLK